LFPLLTLMDGVLLNTIRWHTPIEKLTPTMLTQLEWKYKIQYLFLVLSGTMDHQAIIFLQIPVFLISSLLLTFANQNLIN
jgi:hypothetical protein